MAKKLTRQKARKILHEGTAQGRKITERQRRFFGAIAGGAKPFADRARGILNIGRKKRKK